MTDDDAPAAPKTPLESAVDHAVDAFVYAPIGLLFDGPELLPELVEKGRNQVTMARMIGRFALEQGRDEALKTATKLQDQAAGLLDFIGTSLAGVAGDDPAAPEPARAPAKPPRAPGSARAAARAAAGASTASIEAPVPLLPPASSAPERQSSAGAASTLAIPDYDGLSASQVVSRLAGLSSAELEAVREYEAAHRGRKTILSKVAQLQAG